MDSLDDVLIILGTGFMCLESYPCVHTVRVLTKKLRINKRGVRGDTIAKWYYDKGKRIPMHFKKYIKLVLKEFIKDNDIDEVKRILKSGMLDGIEPSYVRHPDSYYLFDAIWYNNFDIAREIFKWMTSKKPIDLKPGGQFQLGLTKTVLNKDDDDDETADKLTELIKEIVPEFDIMVNLKVLADQGDVTAWKELSDDEKAVTEDIFRSHVDNNRLEIVTELVNNNLIGRDLLEEVVKPKNGWVLYEGVHHNNNYRTIKFIHDYISK